jgi:tetratricopeptide (TPR) repeat protein
MNRLRIAAGVLLVFAVSVASADDFSDAINAAKKGDHDTAIAGFSAVIVKKPAGPLVWSAYLFRGDSYAAKKDYDHAIADYSESARLQPGNSPALAKRGNLYMLHKNELDKAIADFTEVQKFEPKNYSARYVRGHCYLLKKEYALAIPDFSHAIELFPKYPSALRERGEAYVALKENDKAIADFDAVIKLNPPNAKVSPVYDDRGQLHRLKKEYELAAADWNEAIRLDPKNAQALRRLALLLAGCPKDSVRDGKKAVELATRACDHDRYKIAADLEALAAAHSETGNFTEAVAAEKKAISLKKDLKGAADRVKMYEAKKPFRMTE